MGKETKQVELSVRDGQVRCERALENMLPRAEDKRKTSFKFMKVTKKGVPRVFF